MLIEKPSCEAKQEKNENLPTKMGHRGLKMKLMLAKIPKLMK